MGEHYGTKSLQPWKNVRKFESKLRSEHLSILHEEYESVLWKCIQIQVQMQLNTDYNIIHDRTRYTLGTCNDEFVDN